MCSVVLFHTFSCQQYVLCRFQLKSSDTTNCNILIPYNYLKLVLLKKIIDLCTPVSHISQQFVRIWEVGVPYYSELSSLITLNYSFPSEALAVDEGPHHILHILFLLYHLCNKLYPLTDPQTPAQSFSKSKFLMKDVGTSRITLMGSSIGLVLGLLLIVLNLSPFTVIITSRVAQLVQF